MALLLTNLQKKKIASDLIKCFKDVDWGNNRFFTNSNLIKDKNGNETFYATKSIDEAIEKVNKLIKKLQK